MSAVPQDGGQGPPSDPSLMHAAWENDLYEEYEDEHRAAREGSEEVRIANVFSRIASLPSTMNATPHKFICANARDFTASHSPADTIQCAFTAESIHAHRHRGKWLEAER